MNITALGHAAIRVRDLASSEAFYSGVLGMPVVMRFPEEQELGFGIGRSSVFMVHAVGADAPAPDSRNDSPHVYDLNLAIPRAVFIRGDAEFLDDATTVEVFQKQTALHRSRGWTKAPLRTPENIVAELVGVKIRPTQVRVEGFGEGAASFLWKPESQA
jgi:catechol 2,3-dioxygenase-like lactoylglutathione lyase family enzyme